MFYNNANKQIFLFFPPNNSDNFLNSILQSPFIHSKLPGIGETIFTKMSVLAQKHNAINLGQGFPDFPMNKELISLVGKAMKVGHNQYANRN